MRFLIILDFFLKILYFFFPKKTFKIRPGRRPFFTFFDEKISRKKKSPTWWVFGHFIFINLKIFSPDKSQYYSDFVKNPINHSDFVKLKKNNKIKLKRRTVLGLSPFFFLFLKFDNIWMILGFFRGRKFSDF